MGSRSMERSNRDDNKELFWEVWDYQKWLFNGNRGRGFRNWRTLVQELWTDVSATEYVNFDADIPASEPLINEHKIDWRQKSREDCINAVLNEINIAQEIPDDDNEDDEEVDEIEDETLSLLDR